MLSRSAQAELTPRSLPALLAGGVGLDSTIVLWCDVDTSSDMATAFKEQVSSDPHPNLVFAWVNRYYGGREEVGGMWMIIDISSLQ